MGGGRRVERERRTSFGLAASCSHVGLFRSRSRRSDWLEEASISQNDQISVFSQMVNCSRAANFREPKNSFDASLIVSVKVH
jgi:hypothetical protein